MSTADIVIDLHFLQHGKSAPPNSSFNGIMSGSSLFGGYFEYTGRSSATGSENDTKKKKNKSSADTGSESFLGYTSRDSAVRKSMADNTPYFTMSNDGKLFSENDRQSFCRKWINSYDCDDAIAWTMVLSFKDRKTLEKYGISDQEDLARITTVSLHSAFPKIHLDPENMIWWEDYHTNTKHPHIHVTFLEKVHSRDRGKLTPKEVRLLKETFYSKIAAMKVFEEKFNESPETVLKSIQPERKKIVELAKSLSYKSVEKIVNLYTQLPATGRLQYNSSNMEPFRKQLDEIIDDLLKSDAVRSEYEAFEKKLQDLDDTVNALGNEDVSSLKQSQLAKLYAQIGNAILSEYKTGAWKDNNRVAALKMWKEEKGSEILISGLKEIKEKEHLSETADSVLSCILDKRIEEGYELLPRLDNSDQELFIKGAFQVLYPYADEGKIEGINHIFTAAGNNHPQARHYMNFMMKCHGMNKRIYHSFRTTFLKKLKVPSCKALMNQREEIEKEIDLYLRTDDYAVFELQRSEIDQQQKDRWGIRL